MKSECEGLATSIPERKEVQMNCWIKRALAALIGACVLFGNLAAHSHSCRGDGA